MSYRAILFDFGGVIATSPFEAFTAYEQAAQLPRGFIAQLNTHDPDGNAWARMERGELTADAFYAAFAAEAQRHGHTLDARTLFAQLAVRVRPEMRAAVRALRERFIVACVSNNMHLGYGLAMSGTPEAAAAIAEAVAEFHHVFESRDLGMRKPEPRIYEHVCRTLGVAPHECVFLDDLGLNLKPARALGMATIKVGDPDVALRELFALVDYQAPRT